MTCGPQCPKQSPQSQWKQRIMATQSKNSKLRSEGQPINKQPARTVTMTMPSEGTWEKGPLECEGLQVDQRTPQHKGTDSVNPPHAPPFLSVPVTTVLNLQSVQTHCLALLWRPSCSENVFPSHPPKGFLLIYNISFLCCNKVPQTGQFQTTEIYSFTILKTRWLESKHQQGHFSSMGSGKNPSLPLLASGGC